MWKYVRRYLPYALIAAVFMVGEVLMDLLQPEIMSRIVDEGVLGVGNGGAGDMGTICGVYAPSLQSEAIDVIAGESAGNLAAVVALMLAVYLVYGLCQLVHGLLSAKISQ